MRKKNEYEVNKQKNWQEKGLEKCTFQPDTTKKRQDQILKASIVSYLFTFPEPDKIRPFG